LVGRCIDNGNLFEYNNAATTANSTKGYDEEFMVSGWRLR